MIRLHIPGEPAKALRWTHYHPQSCDGLGVLLFRHSAIILDGAQFRALRDTAGAWIETDQPARVRRALCLADDEEGIR